jgi:hypothetical protein
VIGNRDLEAKSQNGDLPDDDYQGIKFFIEARVKILILKHVLIHSFSLCCITCFQPCVLVLSPWAEKNI